ncbi:peptidoglycan-binding domain-containing protein [Flavilitoribacter nigricans]|uniref:Uncharacterized protein n=1 Tax=Flavilitoribacter nigricans (strain ATCC 23147 / DSM 23189 / NBRC 102662 / NCIMB 1420 / SS-2) TaxID=1122177 RepID=A0A2D0N7M2_FLAN2|nr:peptidoglycan-binding domain-containing protein [Flavilitoribacter nigricans]PHN04380.1 hypothetical protein CRP01_22745 [Flavilitoribacter nigricans DSM 23189 = NBRC 102662]
MFSQTKLQRQHQSYNSTQDEKVLDSNEISTFDKAYVLGLMDKSTRQKLFQESLDGALTPFQLEQIKDVQRGLKKDGKYEGIIDGKFGPESTHALKEMIFENEGFREARELIENLDLQENDLENSLPRGGGKPFSRGF